MTNNKQTSKMLTPSHGIPQLERINHWKVRYNRGPEMVATPHSVQKVFRGTCPRRSCLSQGIVSQRGIYCVIYRLAIMHSLLISKTRKCQHEMNMELSDPCKVFFT